MEQVTTNQVKEMIDQLAAMTAAASITPEIVAAIFEKMRNLNDQEREKVIKVATEYIEEIRETGVDADKCRTKSGSNVQVELDTFARKFRDVEEDGFYICNEKREAIAQYKDGKWFFEGLDIKSDSLRNVEEDGFYICNENGDVIAYYINDKWQLVGLDVSTGVKPEKKGIGYLTKKGNLTNGQSLTFERNSVKNWKSLSFSANITSLSKIIIGHGKNKYLSSWVEIDATNIVSHLYTSSDRATTYAHGLTISESIQVEIVKRYGTDKPAFYQNYATIRVISLGNVCEKDIYWAGDNGEIYVTSENSSLTDCVFSWTCKNLNSEIWAFGDSYFSLTNDRWTYYLMLQGNKNTLLNGFSGARSADALDDLKNLLKIGMPKKIIWALGMNDPDASSSANASWKSCYDQVKALCQSNGIELIPCTIPTVIGGVTDDGDATGAFRSHKYKNAIIRNSGLRIIEFDKAVGANETTGLWFDGLLENVLNSASQTYTRVHPTVKGAIVLYQRIITDVPELLNE